MKALNLGCGGRFHPAWENVDFAPTDASIRQHDLRKGIPYADGVFDVVYHSHVLEHFSRADGAAFLRECHRVLKAGGVMRMAVPDLERISRCYIEALERASRGEAGWDANYDWMVMEIYDQTIRETSGGECGAYLRRGTIPNWAFVSARMGAFAETLRPAANGENPASAVESKPQKRSWGYIARNPGKVLRRKLLKSLLGERDQELLEVARFRDGGEIHKWMYDGYSLSRLLSNVGFVRPVRFSATESAISGWKDFHLDAEPDGRPYKADSLYMEATKP
jgi:SAM-dependent methyltransferase